MRRKRPMAALVLLAAVVCIAGAVSSATSAAKPSTIKLGLFAATGLPAGSNPQAVAGARAAVRALNAHGGLHGHPVQLVYCNHKNDPNLSLACARQMVSQHVAAMIGGFAFGDATMIPILAKAHIPLVGLNPLSSVALNSPNVYLFSGGSFIGFQIMMAYAAHHGGTIADVVADNPTSAQLTKSLAATIKSAGGSFTSNVLVSPTQADYAPLAEAARKGNPNGVLLFLDQGQGLPFIQAAESSGGFKSYYELNFQPSEIAKIGGAGNKIRTISAFPPFTSSNPMMKAFVRDLAAEKKSGDSDADIQKVDDISFSAWLATKVIDKLTAGMANITAVNLTNALNKAKNMNLGGVIPAWTPNKKGPTGLARVSNEAQYMLGYKNGHTYQLTTKPVTLAQAIAGKP